MSVSNNACCEPSWRLRLPLRRLFLVPQAESRRRALDNRCKQPWRPIAHRLPVHRLVTLEAKPRE
jgi:hypothetical protein